MENAKYVFDAVMGLIFLVNGFRLLIAWWKIQNNFIESSIRFAAAFVFLEISYTLFGYIGVP